MSKALAAVFALAVLAAAPAGAGDDRKTASLRAYAGPCIAWLVDREDPSWDPGRWNAQGSGAFGLGQALPYTKMPRAAWPRWIVDRRGRRVRGGSEDGFAQIRWMRTYVSRYGGCWGAVAFWQRNGWY